MNSSCFFLGGGAFYRLHNGNMMFNCGGHCFVALLEAKLSAICFHFSRHHVRDCLQRLNSPVSVSDRSPMSLRHCALVCFLLSSFVYLLAVTIAAQVR